nr:hypothetical protein [Tanacetum cinerariifolium]
MPVDVPLQHEVEGWVDRLVDEVEELTINVAKWVMTLEIKGTLEVKTTTPLTTTSMKMIGMLTWETVGMGIHTRSLWHASHRSLMEDFKALMKEEYCLNNKMQKLEAEFWCHYMAGSGHAAYTNRFHKLARLVPHLVTLKTKRIERCIYGLVPQIHRMKSGEKRRDRGELSKEGNVNGDNKKSRTGKAFTIITNPIRKEYMGSKPKYTKCNFHHHPETSCHTCINCNRFRHFAKDCSARPKMVNPLNAKNLTVARGACYECVGTDHYKEACLRAFMMGAEEAHQDPNIVTGTFSLNNHYATMLFDSSAEYSFVSTTFMHLLDIKSSSLADMSLIHIESRKSPTKSLLDVGASRISILTVKENSKPDKNGKRGEAGKSQKQLQ